mgnify:CR=1 FL=1
MEELKYTSKFDGQQSDEILEKSKKLLNAELTTLSDISGFVAIDKEGKAIGMMSKEQVAQVVGGLLPIGYKKVVYVGSSPFKIVCPTGKYLLVDAIGKNIGFKGCRFTIGRNNPEGARLIPFSDTACYVKYKITDSETTFYCIPFSTYVTLCFNVLSDIVDISSINEEDIPSDAINLVV